jgi:hypothetical protein
LQVSHLPARALTGFSSGQRHWLIIVPQVPQTTRS